jgi:predicted transposase YdaD
MEHENIIVWFPNILTFQSSIEKHLCLYEVVRKTIQVINWSGLYRHKTFVLMLHYRPIRTLYLLNMTFWLDDFGVRVSYSKVLCIYKIKHKISNNDDVEAQVFLYTWLKSKNVRKSNNYILSLLWQPYMIYLK